MKQVKTSMFFSTEAIWWHLLKRKSWASTHDYWYSWDSEATLTAVHTYGVMLCRTEFSWQEFLFHSWTITLGTTSQNMQHLPGMNTPSACPFAHGLCLFFLHKWAASVEMRTWTNWNRIRSSRRAHHLGGPCLWQGLTYFHITSETSARMTTLPRHLFFFFSFLPNWSTTGKIPPTLVV